VGQNIKIEKKFAPDIAVITKVKESTRASLFIRDGNIGNLANLISHIGKATNSRRNPSIRGAKT
jgi:hypothetical protein